MDAQLKQQKANKAADILSLKQMATELTGHWEIPPILSKFIANTPVPEETEKVEPWPLFKKKIYEIYNDRIKNSPEINGSISIDYLSLEEYIILYFLKIHKVRKVAESSILDFIASLKYKLKYELNIYTTEIIRKVY